MFCVECGNDVPIFRNGVCLTCYIKATHFSKGPSVIDIIICPRCSSYKFKNTWVQESFENILNRYIKETFTINPELKQVRIQTECKKQQRIFSCLIFISGYLEKQIITEQHPLTVRIKQNTCQICSREAGGYYEAIIQIRAEERTFTKPELRTFQSVIETMVEQFQMNGKRGLFIADIAKKPEGLDFFLSEKGTALSIAKKIQEQFGGELKQSASSAGMKDSKQIYRMTYLVRIPAYRKGDFFSFEKSFFTIVSIHSNKVRTLELATWIEKTFNGKDIQPSKIYGGTELIKEMIVVSQSKNEIQLMDPKNYSIFNIRKPRLLSASLKTVKTVTLDDYLFLIPEPTL